jgi:hypothetical protein
MPRYLSQRKAAKYKEVIEKIARILGSSRYDNFLVEGPRDATYDDLWTIRSTLFPTHTFRFKFKKQFNGVWVEIVPPFSTSSTDNLSLDLWDGETIEQEFSRGMIATKLILDKPVKIRFVRSAQITDKDLDKLSLLSTSNNYEFIVDEKFLSFTLIPNTTAGEQTDAP